MGGPTTVVIYVLVMIVVIVGVDIAFFRYQLLERWLANIGMVLLFAAFYLRFFGRPWPPWG
jgi:Mn2+/Fe2+ NRAMP family transporter